MSFVTIRRRHEYCGFSDETARLRGIAPIALNNYTVSCLCAHRIATLSSLYQPETITLYVQPQAFLYRFRPLLSFLCLSITTKKKRKKFHLFWKENIKELDLPRKSCQRELESK